MTSMCMFWYYGLFFREIQLIWVSLSNADNKFKPNAAPATITSLKAALAKVQYGPCTGLFWITY